MIIYCFVKYVMICSMPTVFCHCSDSPVVFPHEIPSFCFWRLSTLWLHFEAANLRTIDLASNQLKDRHKARENWKGFGWSFGYYVCQISPVFKMSEHKVMAKLSWYLVVLLNNCSCSKRVWDDKHQIWGRCLALLATSSSVHCVTRLIYSNVVTSQYTASTYDVMCSRNFWAFLDHIYDAVEWKTNIINNSNSNKSICRHCLQA